MEEKSSHWLVRAAGPAALFVFALLIYLPSLRAPFTSDDILVTSENPMLGDLANLPRYFTTELDWLVPDELANLKPEKGHSGVYRPVLAASYHLDFFFFGLEATGWRLTNSLMHAANVLLVFVLLFRLLGSRKASLLAAALFAAHPVHVEAVLSLFGGRAELLAGLFVLAGWLSFLRADANTGRLRRVMYLATAALSLLLGFFSKETAVVLPALCFLTAWGLQKRSLKDTLLCLLPQLMIIAIYIALRIWLVGGLAAQDRSFAFGDLPGARIFLSVMVVLVRYLIMITLPFFQNHPDCLQDFPQHLSLFSGLAATFLVLAMCGAATLFVLRSRRRQESSVFSVSTLMFFACLFPVSHVVPFAVVMAQRFLFLPSVAFSLAAGWLWQRHCRAGYLCYAAPATLLALFSSATLNFNITASDPEKMYRLVMECRPQSADSFNNLGTYKLRQGKIAEALVLFEQAMEKNPRLPDPVYNKGLCLQKLGQNREAEQFYFRAIELDPGHAMAANKLGILLSARGQFQEAARLFELAISNDPSHPEPLVNLAIIREQEGNLSEAVRLYRLALKIDSRLSVARQALERLEQARQPQ